MSKSPTEVENVDDTGSLGREAGSAYTKPPTTTSVEIKGGPRGPDTDTQAFTPHPPHQQILHLSDIHPSLSPSGWLKGG